MHWVVFTALEEAIFIGLYHIYGRLRIVKFQSKEILIGIQDLSASLSLPIIPGALPMKPVRLHVC